ncbi:urease accessory protein UreE [Skermanella stibiiresistens SB22]|uniref:Urease accessory protein UreE n=1 Tax=Skermanella stibiiresistens SB22 TaxID=1385369 RepID=W9GYD3_9PROT|nr:urease accessory protein UreE [Skermanella stibiiresistens]EWY38824.1 urease accessory protein UreE [Skermanella stibiiresistens SB22]
MLRRATLVHHAGHWPAADAAGTVTLTFDDRFRRRIQLNDDAGEPFLLDLARAVVLNDGDALELDDGTLVAVRAAPEDLAEVTCATPETLARIAWHLGNRHLPVQIAGAAIRLRWDHVIVDMLTGLGAEVVRTSAGFTPESGAYAHHDH